MKRKLILSICGSIKTLKVKDIDKDENNNLMSFHIDDEKLLEKYKTTWIKIECFIVVSLGSFLFMEINVTYQYI